MPILDENLLATELQVDETASYHLRETARWCKFLGIAGMIISILIALVGIFVGFLFNSMSSRYGSGPANLIGSGFISIFYLIIAAITFFTSIFLFFFGSKMKTALQILNQETFNEALLNQKRYYRIIGIITIIYLSFIALGVIFGGIGAMLSI